MVNWLRGLMKRASVFNVSLSNWVEDDWGPAPSSGVYVSEEVALTCSAVYRATAIIAQSMAGLPVEVVRVKGKTVQVVDHYVTNLLNLEFNPSEGSVLGRERVQTSALLGRAGYAEIVPTQDRTRTAKLNVIHPNRVKPVWVQNPDTKEYERFFQIDNGPYIPDRRMIQIPGFGFDGLEGRSVIRQAAEAIGHAKALETYGAGNFGSGTVPRGVLKTSKTVTAEQKSKMRRSWAEVHTRPNDIAVLDEDYEFKPIDINNEDRQFLQSRSFQVVEVARWFGVPPHMLAELKDANYATTEHLGSEFKTLTLQPWVNRWEQELTRKLLTPEERTSGLRVSLDMDGLLRAEYTTRMNGHRTAITTGLKTINECRTEEGLAPSPDPRCDTHLIQLNIAGADGNTATTAKDDPATGGEAGTSQ